MPRQNAIEVFRKRVEAEWRGSILPAGEMFAGRGFLPFRGRISNDLVNDSYAEKGLKNDGL